MTNVLLGIFLQIKTQVWNQPYDVIEHRHEDNSSLELFWFAHFVHELLVGLSDAVEASTSGVLSLHRETKFIIGFDFAVTLSSPESFCVLFDITSEQTVELKWLILNKHNK